MTILEEYIAKHPKSQELYNQAKELIPGGVTHDARYMSPFPVFMDRGEGSRVWDVDDNEYIDYHPGHGTYILGYRHPAIVAAITDQLTNKGVEFGSSNELETKVAELLLEIFPCAEQVRYIGSGAEANMLAIRLARAYTGKDKFIKFGGHWHGGFDEGFLAVSRPFDVPYSAGTPKDAFRNVLLAKHNDIEDVKRLIESNDDIACVIMEPTGARHGQLPGTPDFVRELRQITKEKGIILILDEVMDNLKLAPGGGQEVLGVCPDLSVLGKAIGFGLPLAAVIGKKEIMQRLAFSGDKKYDLYNRVRSHGTHSGTPIALAAALAGLKLLKTGELQAQMNRMTDILRKGLNELIKRHNIRGCPYGDYSMVRIFLNHNCPYLGKCDVEHCPNPDHEFLDAGTEASLKSNLVWALLNNGVNFGLGRVELFVSAAITEKDVQDTLVAVDRSLTAVKGEGLL